MSRAAKATVDIMALIPCLALRAGECQLVRKTGVFGLLKGAPCRAVPHWTVSVTGPPPWVAARLCRTVHHHSGHHHPPHCSPDTHAPSSHTRPSSQCIRILEPAVFMELFICPFLVTIVVYSFKMPNYIIIILVLPLIHCKQCYMSGWPACSLG